jgi:hypothetical protein
VRAPSVGIGRLTRLCRDVVHEVREIALARLPGVAVGIAGVALLPVLLLLPPELLLPPPLLLLVRRGRRRLFLAADTTITTHGGRTAARARAAEELLAVVAAPPRRRREHAHRGIDARVGRHPRSDPRGEGAKDLLATLLQRRGGRNSWTGMARLHAFPGRELEGASQIWQSINRGQEFLRSDRHPPAMFHNPRPWLSSEP